MTRAAVGCWLILLGLLLCLVPAQAGQVSFNPPQVVPVRPASSLVGDITMADYSRNGWLDIIGSSIVSRQITIEFWPNIPLWQTNGALSIATALRNLTSLAAGDLNRDGSLEIVLSGATSASNVLLYYGQAPQPIADTAVDQIELGDVDGDGDLDVVGGNATGQVSWWENSSNTNWPVHGIGTLAASTFHCVAADLDGDGDTDVAAGLPGNSDSLIWWENRNGRGTDWQSHAISTDHDGGWWPRAVDLDLDGDLDLAESTFEAPGVCWWENTRGDATAWTARPLTSGFESTGPVQAADLDQDGDLDLVASEFYGPGMVWWENQRGQPLRWVRRSLPADPGQHIGAAQIGDFDRDGDLDIVYRTATSISWLESRTIHRSAVFPTSESVFDFLAGATGARTADINGDGLLDIVATSSLDQGIRTWLNNGVPSSRWFTWNVDLSPSGTVSVFPADLDQDGDLDILGAAYALNAILWWENDDSNPYLPSWTLHSIATGFGGAQDVTAADLDGDGDLDVLGAASVQNRVSWWQNDGTPRDGGWVPHDVSLSFAGARVVAAADLDRDGDTDVIGAADLDHEIVWWENNPGPGAPSFAAHSVDVQVPGIRSLDLADLDRDGDLDILGAAFEADQVYWWENAGGSPSAWPRRAINDSAFHGPRDARAADLDHDGDLDVLGAGSEEQRLQWWENLDGAGGEWLAHTNALNFPNAESLAVGDLDHDGDLDLVATGGSTSSQIMWWPNQGGQFAAPTTNVGPAALWDSQTAALLALDLTHRGRPGDSALELGTLKLLLEQAPGDPLTQSEANAILDSLSVYHDDGNDRFGSEDVLVLLVPTLSLTQGVATLNLSPGAPNPGISPGATGRFFVAVTTTADAHGQSPAQFRMTLPGETGTAARDREDRVPLLPEFSRTVASDRYLIRELPPLWIQACTRQADGSVHLQWNALGPEWGYTVQCAVGLTNGSWQPLPAVSWPIQANTWTDTNASNASNHFYRIQAESLGL